MSEGGAMARGDGRKRLGGTRPFAETRGQLAASARRLQTLLAACTQDCERRLTSLRRLPACASVDPFAAMQAGPPAGADDGAVAGAASSTRGGSLRDARPMSRDVATSLRSAGHGLAAATARAGRITTVAPGRPDDAARRRTGPAQDAPDSGAEPDPLPTALTGMSGLAGALVGELIARFPDHDPRSRKRADASRRSSQAPARPGPGAPQPVPVPYPALGRRRELVPGSTRLAAHAAARGAPPPASPLATPSAALLAALLQAGGPPARAGVSEVSGGVPLLARVLTDLAAASAARTTRPQASTPGLAPRAASRLLGPVTPATSTKPHTKGESKPPAAPEGDPIEDADAGSTLARQLNRQLLDQAWLRGVDLT